MPREFKPQQGKTLPYYWHNGRIGNRDVDGGPTINTFSQAMDYSFLLIEGMRVNMNERGKCFGFRLKDHVMRMLDGWKMLGRTSPYSAAHILKGAVQCAAKNLEYLKEHGGVHTLYLRPKIFVSEDCIKPFTGSKTEVTIEAFPFGEYVSREGISATIADYVRTHRYSSYLTKGAGKYPEYGMMREQTPGHYDDVFQCGLGSGGRLIFTEGTTNNVFFVKDGSLYSPGDDDFLLCGITRDSVIKMARHLGIKTVIGEVPLPLILECDEIFITGTATFITPVTRLGKFSLQIGPVTKKLTQFFQKVRSGREKKFSRWLTRIALGAV